MGFHDALGYVEAEAAAEVPVPLQLPEAIEYDIQQREQERSNRDFRDDLRLAMGRDASQGKISYNSAVDVDRLWAKIERGISKEQRSAVISLPRQLSLGSLVLATALLFLGTIAAFRFVSKDDRAPFASSPDGALDHGADSNRSFPLSQKVAYPRSSTRAEYGHCNPDTQSCVVQTFL